MAMSEIITSIVDKIEESNKEVVQAVNSVEQAVQDSKNDIIKAVNSVGHAMNDVKLELATGNQQTHELLSNIAEILNRKL